MPEAARTFACHNHKKRTRYSIHASTRGLLLSSVAVTAMLAAIASGTPARAEEPADHGLLWLGYPDGYDVSYAYDVSADGSVVIGTAGSDNLSQIAFRWSADTGMTVLPGVGADGRAVSGDGRTVVGYHIAPADGGGTTVEAFRWTEAGGLVGLGTAGYTSSVANGVSSDGSVVVGGVSGAGQNVAFAWTEATGIQLLGWMVGGAPSTMATDISDTGIVVGYGRMAIGGYQAFYKVSWRSGSAYRVLGYLDGGNYSRAEAVTNDAMFIAGEATDAASTGHAVRWAREGDGYGEAVALDGGTGWVYSEATDISADGATVVGLYILEDEGDGTSAFRWSEASGAQSLDAWLAESGVAVGGWILREATAVSDDGLTIVGWAETGEEQYQAFLARAGLLIGVANYSNSVASLQDAARLPSSIATGRVLNSMPKASGRTGLSASFEYEHVHGSSSNLGGGMLTWRKPGWAITGGLGIVHAQTSSLYEGGNADYSGVWFGGGGALDLGKTFAVSSLDGLEISANFRADSLNATINRNYLNGSTVETATGSTDVTDLTGALRASWHQNVAANLVLTPYAQGLTSRSTMAAYNETGGVGAGSVSKQTSTANLIAAGIEAGLQISSRVELGATYAFNHLINGEAASVSITIPTLTTFAAPAASYESNWHTVGLDLGWSPTDKVRFNTYASANLGGNYAENWAIGASIEMGF